MLGIAPGIMAGCIPEAAIIICAETLLRHPSDERSSTPVSPTAPTQEAMILIIRHMHELAPSQNGLDLDAPSCTHSVAECILLGHHNLVGSTDTHENWHHVIRCCPCQILFCRSDQDGAQTCASDIGGISARPAYPVSLAISGLSHQRPQSDIARQHFLL